MIKKRHRWLKVIGRKKKLYRRDNLFIDTMHLTHVAKCMDCGLLKGKQNHGLPAWQVRYPTTIYFFGGQYLSKNKIPFTCKHDMIDFIKEEEFMI